MNYIVFKLKALLADSYKLWSENEKSNPNSSS